MWRELLTPTHMGHSPTLPLAALVTPWPCWGQARARLSPASAWCRMPLSPCPSKEDKTRGASGGTLLWGKGMARLWRHQGLKGCQGLGHTPGLCLWRKSEPGVNWGANRSSFSSFPPAPQCTLG